MFYISYKLKACLGIIPAALLALTGFAGTQPADLKASFVSPPADFRPWTWWHWMDGNISKEGIQADVQAMKAAGIGGAQIFDIGGMDKLQEGPVAFMSPEWLDCFRCALEEADKQGLQIGVNCSAGWANSGGPWIKLKDSMRKLVASQTMVHGPVKFSGTLERGKAVGPGNGIYQDVALFAVNADERLLKPTKVDSSLGQIDAEQLQANSKDFALAFPQGAENFVLFDFGEPVAPATLYLRFGQVDVYLEGEVLSSDDGAHFKSVRKISFSKRWLPMDLYPLSLDAAGDPPRARYFKVVLRPQSNPVSAQTKVAAMWLSPQFSADSAAEKSGMGEEYNFPQPPRLAATHAAQIVNLTGKLSESGSLEWDVPAGDWVLLRVGATSTGASPHPARKSSDGFECDKLEPQAFDLHWNSMMEPLLKKAEGTHAFTNAVIDSYEVGGQNWSDGIVKRFQATRGYDPFPYLPAVFGISVGSKDATERFLYDWRTNVSEMMAQNYFGRFAERCEKAGLFSATEPYWGNFDCVAAGKTAKVPMGEFWLAGKGVEADYCRVPSSVAHIYGQEVVAAESFTHSDLNMGSKQASKNAWREAPFLFKAVGDWQFCAGINRFVLHSYIHQPFLDPRAKPGFSLGIFGSHFGRNQTWWPFAGAWTDYLSRCQLLLRQGHSRADVCVFPGENTPNKMFPGGAGTYIKKSGYDYDVCDLETLVSRFSVDDGGMLQVPSGASYRILSVKDASLMSVGGLKAIERLLNNGAVVCSPKPLRTPGLAGYPDSEKELAAIADRLWGNAPGARGDAHVGKGRLFWGMKEAEVLAALNYGADFKPEGQPGLDIGWIHRSASDREIYFLCNQPVKPVAFDASFRGTGFEPEFWYPETGKTEKCAVYSEDAGRTKIPVSLSRSGSVFVVLKRNPEQAAHALALSFTPAAMPQAEVPKTPAPTPTPTPTSQNEPLVIKSAIYGAASDSTGKDVAELLRNSIKNGKLSIMVDNNALGGDPAPMKPKKLTVEYILGGKENKIGVPEYQSLSLDSAHAEAPASSKASEKVAEKVAEKINFCHLEKTDKGAFVLTFSAKGIAKVAWASGHSAEVEAKDIPAPLPLEGAWQLRFPEGSGAPATAALEKLAPLSESTVDGIRYFSGIVTYEKEFTVPKPFMDGQGKQFTLCLGGLGDGGVARAELNGVDLGVIWTAPFEADVSRALRAGTNRLVVKLATPWANRLIGDEKNPRQAPEWAGSCLKAIPDWLKSGGERTDGRVAFITRAVFVENSPLARSGLPGPVEIQVSQRIPVDGK